MFEAVGDLDHLVFTAGDGFTPRPLAELDLTAAQAVFGVRFWGAVTVIRHAIARLSPAGSITLTTGTVCQRPIPDAALAAAGAAAAEALVRGLAVEPEQIAMAHLYLMRNGHVTGTVLGVDGGSLLTAG